MTELNLYVERGFYNFFIGALLTIFVPFRLVEGWFGPGQWFGPLMVPLLGLLLAPAAGTETALVLALFVKGASTGAGVAALMTFPLITLFGLGESWRRYGLKATLSFGFIVWGIAAIVGVALDTLGINANV